MYCSECGKEVSGKFCCYCGAKLASTEPENVVIPVDDNGDGDNIDYDMLLQECDYSKTKAVVKLRGMTGMGLKECQALLNEPYKKYLDSNPKLKKNETAYQGNTFAPNAEWEAEKAAYRQAKELSGAEDDCTVVKCPKCGSTSLSADKKGFGFGKAAAGLLVAGPVGLLAGGIGAGNVMVTCLSCGNRFKAGKN